MATVTYEAKKWGIKKLRVIEMKFLRSMCDVIRFDRARNEEVKCRVGVKESMSDKMDQKVMKWFGHMEHVSEELMTKRV